MYWNIHYRLHTVEVMQYKACAQPQDDEGMGRQGQVYDGMVLRIQAAYSDKRPWRDNTMDAHARERGRPWPLKDKDFTQRLFGKIFADRGYISQELFERLFIDDIHLVTKLKKNMKNSLMDLHDKILLRKRALIETVNDELKNVCYIEHTRHRSIDGFASNLIAGLIAYNLLPKKPSLNIDIIDKSRLIA